MFEVYCSTQFPFQFAQKYLEVLMSEEENDEIITEEMLWERIPETNGIERANTYYELSARIYARGQFKP